MLNLPESSPPERMAAGKYLRIIEFRARLPQNSLGKVLKDRLSPGTAA
jgi:hypothetical protein